jgi:hypothetical protein
MEQTSAHLMTLWKIQRELERLAKDQCYLTALLAKRFRGAWIGLTARLNFNGVGRLKYDMKTGQVVFSAEWDEYRWPV